jgi:hypothetical protein
VSGYRFSVGEPESKILSARLEDYNKIDLRETRWKVWTGFIWLRTGPVADCLECGFSVMIIPKTKV